MKSVILIKELTANGNITVHQVHTTWDTARATLRESYSTCKGLTIEFKPNGRVGGYDEEFVTVSFDRDDMKIVQRFGITEMPLFDCVDHL